MASVSGLNPAMLVWARERSGQTIEEVASAMGKDVPVVQGWEAGNGAPTYVQLEKLAYSIFRRPLALFFFPKPPAEPEPEQSFRTLPEFEVEELSPETRFRIRQARAMQLSFAELAGPNNPAPRQILRDLRNVEKPEPRALAAAVRSFLAVDLQTQRSWKSNEHALRAWRTAVEQSGVFVFKDSFKQREVSGFSLYDKEFPVIYINNSTAKTRQMFTLFHELGHLLTHNGGVTKRDDRYIERLKGHSRDVEIFCNRFAADVLIPSETLNREDLVGSDDNIAKVARHFRVSREVVLRRLLDLEAISSQYFRRKMKKWATDYYAKADDDEERPGGNYYATRASYLSDTFARAAFHSYYSGTITMEELARHLNLKPSSVAGLEQALLQKAG